MKRTAGIMDKFIAIATAPHVVAQIGLHPCLQPQTQANPALVMDPLFAVNELKPASGLGLEFRQSEAPQRRPTFCAKADYIYDKRYLLWLYQGIHNLDP